MRLRSYLSLLVCFCLSALSPVAGAAEKPQHRIVLSLNGEWSVGESVIGDEMPATFGHTAPVPGLTHSATPAFPGIDQYQSRELLANLHGQGLLAESDYQKLGDGRGISNQTRNYFWYRTSFQAPPQSNVALLRVNKAQFGTVLYLNGVRIGEHDPCFTSVSFDITRAIHWNAPNVVVIRIGAHPGVLPSNVSQGTDFEKNRWTPGIYDDVSLMTMNNPVISVVQVAPKLASLADSTPSILVQTELHNYSDHAVTTSVEQEVFERVSHRAASQKVSTSVEVSAGATKLVKQNLLIPNAHLWSPEDPFLYRVVTTTAGDGTTTQFGMREFHFDTTTQRAYLNGRPYLLRGSNITAHRFFEDPEVGTLPWNEPWLHRLLVEIPKQMHWNTFRFCIGPVPDRWLEIADENGLLIQNEYMVWVGHPTWKFPPKPTYDSSEMIGEYTEWMRDNWNHPSVAIWDATNESWLPDFTSKVIPAVRSLDLSNRPWENSFNAPAGGDDPVEDHQYLFYDLAMDEPNGKTKSSFEITDLESLLGPASNLPTSKTGHAMILNEYGWLWLNRDGTPTQLTKKLYPKLLGDRNTTENRFALQASLLAGETEFWRAYRRYAGVLHFVYLTASDPKAFTSDHFVDIKTLKLEPHFEKAMEQAFNPLGVYLNFWHDKMPVEETRSYTIAMVNDEDRRRTGKLRLSFTDVNGKESSVEEAPFEISPLGAQSYTLELKAPSVPGLYSLRATAIADDDPSHPTISQRSITLQLGMNTEAGK